MGWLSKVLQYFKVVASPVAYLPSVLWLAAALRLPAGGFVLGMI